MALVSPRPVSLQMYTVARSWLLLTASYIAANSLVFVLVWRTIDLRAEIVAQYAAIPILQAIALAFVSPDLSARPVVRAVKLAVSRPLIAALWCMEGALLFFYWWPQFGIDLTETVARTAGIETLSAAAIILLSLSGSKRARAMLPAIIPFVLLIVVLGSNGVRPWLGNVPGLLPAGWPLLLRQLLCLSVLLITLTLLTAKVQAAVVFRSPTAAAALGGIYPFFMVAALSLIVNKFLYATLTQPWLKITNSALSLAATCLFTSAISLLLLQEQAKDKTVTANQNPARNIGLPGLWLVLVLSSFGAMALFQVFLFGHWNWNPWALLSLSLIPLVQASWFRWAHELRGSWRALCDLTGAHPVLFVLLLTETLFFCYITVVFNLWEGMTFGAVIRIWIGVKLAVLGSVILMATIRGKVRRASGTVCGAGALICAMGTVLAHGYSEAGWMIAVFGSVLTLTVVRRSVNPDSIVRLAGATAEAFLAPILVMGLCTLFATERPMELVAPMAYTLVALSTTLIAMGFQGRGLGFWLSSNRIRPGS